jgi:DNA-binding transcriptional ArsR family regulator
MMARMSAAAADGIDLSTLAAAIGEPARAKMLGALMDGRALTATELSLEAGVTPSTASSHLAQLGRAGLVRVAAQGRHRYFRIAGADVAALLEQLMGAAAATSPRCGPRDPLLRRARVCYDHLAGGRGVQLLSRLRAAGLVRELDGALLLGEGAEAWLAGLGIRRPPLRRSSSILKK